MSMCPSFRVAMSTFSKPRGSEITWPYVDKILQVYSMDLETKRLWIRILNFGPCTMQGHSGFSPVGRDDPAWLGWPSLTGVAHFVSVLLSNKQMNEHLETAAGQMSNQHCEAYHTVPYRTLPYPTIPYHMGQVAIKLPSAEAVSLWSNEQQIFYQQNDNTTEWFCDYVPFNLFTPTHTVLSSIEKAWSKTDCFHFTVYRQTNVWTRRDTEEHQRD